MPSLALRPYQVEAVSALKAALIKKPAALMVMPCAAGKTICFLEITKWLRKYNKRVLYLLDRENLVSQTHARAEAYLQEPVGVACASVSKHHGLDKPVVAASRQTLSPLLRNGSADLQYNLVVIDEAHMQGKQQKFIIEKLRENYPQTRFLLATATPFRAFGGKIYGKPGDLCDAVDYKVSYAELLERGYLAPLVWMVPESVQLKLLDAVAKSPSGELDEAEQAELLGNPTFISGVVDKWAEHAQERRTVVYAVNIAHGELISQAFAARGVYAPIIHSKMHIREVRKRVKEFEESGRVLVNVSILSLGSDVRSIACIILARRILSTALFMQVVGRGARLFPGKEDCLILDVTGCSLVHGNDMDNPITQIQDGEAGPGQKKLCPMCEAECSQQARTCKNCGFQFPVAAADPEYPDGQTKIEDHGDPGKLVKFGGFVTRFAVGVQYGYHHGPKGPCVECVYRCRDDAGKMLWVRQWKFPQSAKDTFPQKDAARYWFGMGGSYPPPVTVQDWLARQGELTQNVKVTMDLQSGKYPVVKRVEAVSRLFITTRSASAAVPSPKTRSSCT